jgi:hypothetical protein
MTEPNANRVAVTDFDMPFLSMVRFMVKWAIAAIPAVFIIMLAAALFWGIVLGAVTTLGTTLVQKASAPATPTTATQDSGSTPRNPPADTAVKAYLSRVVVSNVHVGRNVLDELGVFGEVKNIGDRALKEVEITIYCLGADGKPVFEKKYYPVLATDLSFGDEKEPLKPGYSRTFGVKMDDAPSDWAKKVNVEVTSVAFQEGGI